MSMETKKKRNGLSLNFHLYSNMAVFKNYSNKIMYSYNLILMFSPKRG